MMYGLPDEIVPRVQQLLRMLASDQDGEALAAARALGRALAGAGRSFHDLADAVEPTGSAAPDRSPVPPWESHNSTAWNPTKPMDVGPPAWADLRDFERRDWLTAFTHKMELTDKGERVMLLELRTKALTEQMWQPTRGQLQLFARLMARAWRSGVRP